VGDFPVVPPVADVNLTLTFDYQIEITTPATRSYECASTTIPFETAAGGAFRMNASVPPSYCDRDTCTYYTGPFGPAQFGYAGPLPTGYYFNGTIGPGGERPELVAAFQNLSLTPGGPLVLSVGAPTRVSVTATDALGHPTPAALAVGWRLPNGNWTLGNTTGPATAIVGETDDSPAVLTATVNATFHGTTLPARTVNEAVNALSTQITQAAPGATAVDAGAPVTVSVLGSGAIGYAYTATFFTGFQNASVSAPCSATPAIGGAVVVGCTLAYTYAEAGEASPSVELTNGYSASARPLPTLSLAPGMELEVSPTPVRMYVDTPTVVHAGVVAGTGTPPYGPACLADGTGVLHCSAAAGPSWGFTVEYTRPGAYAGAFTVVDGSGTNRSLAVPIEAGVRPSLPFAAASSSTADEGRSVELSAVVAGGVGPLAYWWNASAPDGTVAAGALAGGGAFNVTYTPTAPGMETLTLTVVDALGTVIAGSVPLDVLPGPAASLAPAAGRALAPAISAGTSAPFAWEALSADGLRVPDYAAPVTLTFGAMPAGSDPVVLHALRGPPESLGGNLTLTLAANDWQDGFLNFSLTFTRSGNYAVTLGGALAPRGALDLTVGPDPTALLLVDPSVALAGARENHTRWFLEDAFGNPGPTAPLNLTMWFDGSAVSSPLAVDSNGSATWTWVNFTAPGSDAGSYEVRSASGELLLGPIAVPATAPAPPLPLGAILTAVGLLGAAGAVVAYRRLRGARPRRAMEADLDELAEYARGREALLGRIRSEGPLDLAALRRGAATRADRAQLAEWLASLTTEGLVTSEPGPGGAPRFRAARIEAPSSPRVDLDPLALERALRQQDPGEDRDPREP
jgi:hypothetical protein